MLKEYLSNIADQFRTHLDTTEPINAQDFAGKIEDVAVKYNLSGFANGREVGYSQGLEEGIEQGKQAEYDRFWDAYQQNGNRTSYNSAFSGHAWNEETLKPKYDIVPVNANQIFKDLQMSVNISEYLAKQGIVLDFSKTTTFSEFLLFSKITEIGVVDTRNAGYLTYAFSYAQSLHTIGLLIFKEDGSQYYNSSTFGNCNALKNITIQGVIGNDFLMSASPLLTIESMRSVISALKNFSGTNTSCTVQFHATAKAKLTETDIANITQKGWTLA